MQSSVNKKGSNTIATQGDSETTKFGTIAKA